MADRSAVAGLGGLRGVVEALSGFGEGESVGDQRGDLTVARGGGLARGGVGLGLRRSEAGQLPVQRLQRGAMGFSRGGRGTWE